MTLVTEIVAAVDAEPELPGNMPDTMWELIRNDRDAFEELMRIVVRETKAGIRERLCTLLENWSEESTQ